MLGMDWYENVSSSCKRWLNESEVAGCCCCQSIPHFALSVLCV